MSVSYDAAVFQLGGDPGAIAASAARWSAFSVAAGGAADNLGGLDTDEFSGDEADRFRESLNGRLAGHLRTSAEAWGMVGSSLQRFGAALADCQDRLRPLQIRAQDASTGGDTEELESLRSTALAVRADHECAATACTADIRRATGMRFVEPPGWFGGLVDGITGWIADHAPMLKTISAALKQISSIAGMLAMIPVLAPIMAPIAVATGAAAVTIEGAVMVATGQGSVGDLVLDTASMIPGARAATAVGAAQTAQEAYRATQGDESWTDVLVSAASVVVGARGGAHRTPEGPRPQAVRETAAPPASQTSATPDAAASNAAGATGTEPGLGGGAPWPEPAPTAQIHHGDQAATEPVTSAEAAGGSDDPASASEGGKSNPRPGADTASTPAQPLNLPPETEYIYQVVTPKVPPDWGPPIPNSKTPRGKPGLRWFGPNPNAEGIRVDVGDPNSPYPTQHVDHVIVRSNHDALLPDGSPAIGGIKENWQCHIPLDDWLQWREWNRP